MRLESPSGVLGFSADTAPCEAVSDLVRNADVFLCEAALGSDGEEEDGDRGHLNAREAGDLAAKAGVKHLVLTHYDSRANAVDMRDAAAREFSGPITVADDGVEIALGQYT
jgi:ribonuclease BN (tRNA processing enzyme)